MKANWNTIQYQKSQRILIKNVISATISNHSDQEVTFFKNGVPRILPPVNKTTKLPVGNFVMELNGVEFDIDVQINFLPAGQNKIIVDYAQLEQSKIC